MPFSDQPDMSIDAAAFARLAAPYCKLPHANVIAKLGGAVFPTIRDQKNRLTFNPDRNLLLDDNVTPRWALLWAHGMAQTHHPKGWTIAHVWALPKDPDAYTNLANLCLMPECLGSLSDKRGPLVPFLQYHANSVYGWNPSCVAEVIKPEGFDEIRWSYFDDFNDPAANIKNRIMTLNNQRVKILRDIMGYSNG